MPSGMDLWDFISPCKLQKATGFIIIAIIKILLTNDNNCAMVTIGNQKGKGETL
jgi:hypothetical protein